MIFYEKFGVKMKMVKRKCIQIYRLNKNVFLSFDHRNYITKLTEQLWLLIFSVSFRMNYILIPNILFCIPFYSQAHIAISSGAQTLTRNIIDCAPYPALLDIENVFGQSPIHLAVLMGQSMIVRHLLISGAKV